MDLWDFGLNPKEYMAAHYLERTSGRTTGREIAERLGVSRKTADRILASLADKGLIQRVSRGRYVLLWVTLERSPVTLEGSSVTLPKVLSSSSTTNHVLVGMSNDIPTRAARPFRGIYNERSRMADDFEPGRLKPSKPKPAKRTLFNKPDKYHRFTQPREEWGIPHLVKEFGIRSQHAFPDSIYVVEGRSLSATLAMAQRDWGLSVPQLMTAMEQFFDHHSKDVPDDTSPTRYFLAHLKDYIRQQPGYENATFGTANATTEGDGFDD